MEGFFLLGLGRPQTLAPLDAHHATFSVVVELHANHLSEEERRDLRLVVALYELSLVSLGILRVTSAG